MWHTRVRILGTGLLFLIAMLDSAQAADRDAEFAIRWKPLAGGPKTADDVIKLLALPKTEADEYKVTYYSVTPPADVPPGYSVIARQRIKGEKKAQLMIKYRGSAPLPATFDIPGWKCALGEDAEMKYEVDISFTSQKKSDRAYSLSCSLKSKGAIAFPDSLNAVQSGQSSDMLRYETNDLKIEEWTLYPSKEKIIEVSRSGSDTKSEYQAFAKNVGAKLISSGAHPLNTSKSTTSKSTSKPAPCID